MKPYFQDNREHFFYQESVLANSCLEHGAKILINTVPCSRDERNYYTAFFNLSIGIERFLKVMILQLELFNKNEITSVPLLKKIGHKLIDLYNEMAKRMNIAIVNEGHKNYKLLKLFDDFANNDRYFNIIALDSDKKPQQDILSKWYELCSENYSNQVDITPNNIKYDGYSIFEKNKDERITNEDIVKISLKMKKITPYIVQEIQALLSPIFNYMEYRYFKHKEGTLAPYINFKSIFSFFSYQVILN